MSITQTYKNIPALRFPEFVNDGEWEVKRLGDILIFLTADDGYDLRFVL